MAAAAAAVAAAMELDVVDVDDVAGGGERRDCGVRGIVSLHSTPFPLREAIRAQELLQLLRLTPTSLPCCATQRPEL